MALANMETGALFRSSSYSFDGLSRMRETVLMEDERPKRRKWFQFRLRTLLVAILVLSLSLSWYAVKVERIRRQKRIGSIIEGAGGTVSYERTEPPVPQWIRGLFGDDFFVVTAVTVNEEWVIPEGEEVVNVPVGWDAFGDDEATYLKELPDLKVLSLNNTQVSDAGLKHLKRLTNLKILWLDNTQITDSGLEHLKGLTNLEYLTLRNTQVSDAGLDHLEGLTNLKVLYLDNTQVTDEGGKRLEEALPNSVIKY